VTGDDAAFQRAVREFLHAMAVPTRRREPRVADRFGTMPPTMVPTRWGDVAAWRLGSGSAVLLVHGWEDDNSLWSPLVDELARRGRALVAFDLPGHGASGGDWAASFEGSDAIKDVTAAVGPIDAVVGHSAGCGVAAGAMVEGWAVARAAFIAPPLAEGNRWLRRAEQLGVPADVAVAAQTAYHAVHGPGRAAWHPRTAYPTLDVDLLVIQSRDDERHALADTEAVVARHPRARLEIVDGLSHRQTARDPAVVQMVTAFVAA
jgi:pimeloyl-ACP methyl ester carboxylesterase